MNSKENNIRRFLVLGHNTPLDPNFSLNNLPGEGRIDILCRCINSAFFLSHSIRKKVRLYLVLQNKVTIRLEGKELKHLNPDERSTAALIKKALEKRKKVRIREKETTPGIYISERNLEDILKEEKGNILHLHENTQTQLKEIKKEKIVNPFFILSDHKDLTKKEKKIIEKERKVKISISPKILHANHTIIVAHNHLDYIQEK